MMGGGGGVVPPALLDESRVPRFYRDAIAACGATQHSMLPHTALVYNLMVTSGLPRSVLSYIWSAVNRTLPGQLTRPEFFSCLALIALAQKGESLVALSTMSSLPIPFLQPIQVPAEQSLPAPVVNVAKPPKSLASKQQRQSSSFIPTSLLPGRRNAKKKEVDLLGEPLPPFNGGKTEQPSAQTRPFG
uniref:EH domain-containing protein n=1 Tax=Angiostrongylus cantonensis TaxID=6313 RepID=A0A0K0DHI1_ANGCA